MIKKYFQHFLVPFPPGNDSHSDWGSFMFFTPGHGIRVAVNIPEIFLNLILLIDGFRARNL